jgi:hypothetical protein
LYGEYPDEKPNGKKSQGGMGCTSASRRRGEGENGMSPLIGADLDMEKINEVSPRHAAEIRRGSGVPLDIGTLKANVYI